MENAIVILAIHENELIGLATGYPFIYEEESLKDLFTDHHLDPKNYFCVGETVLKKDYRRQGLRHKFFDILEKHVKDLKIYPSICFYTVKREENDPKRPLDYFPLASFWKKRGYKEHLDLIGTIKWQEIGMTKEIPHEMVFWTKP